MSKPLTSKCYVYEPFIVFLFQALHVFSYVTTVNILFQYFSVERFVLGVVAGKTFIGMRNEDSAVAGTLECAKYTGSSRGASQTDIEIAFKWPRSIFFVEGLNERECTVGFRDTLVLVRKAEFS